LKKDFELLVQQSDAAFTISGVKMKSWP